MVKDSHILKYPVCRYLLYFDKTQNNMQQLLTSTEVVIISYNNRIQFRRKCAFSFISRGGAAALCTVLWAAVVQDRKGELWTLVEKKPSNRSNLIVICLISSGLHWGFSLCMYMKLSTAVNFSSTRWFSRHANSRRQSTRIDVGILFLFFDILINIFELMRSNSKPHKISRRRYRGGHLNVLFYISMSNNELKTRISEDAHDAVRNSSGWRHLSGWKFGFTKFAFEVDIQRNFWTQKPHSFWMTIDKRTSPTDPQYYGSTGQTKQAYNFSGV